MKKSILLFLICFGVISCNTKNREDLEMEFILNAIDKTEVDEDLTILSRSSDGTIKEIENIHLKSKKIRFKKGVNDAERDLNSTDLKSDQNIEKDKKYSKTLETKRKPVTLNKSRKIKDPLKADTLSRIQI